MKRTLLAVSALPLVIELALGTPAVARQIRGDALRQQFEHETDAVRKAKLLWKLGKTDFDEIHKQVDGGHLDAGAALAASYRDDCRAAQRALDATHVDPEKHPAGYKELQMSVRDSLRRLSDILTGLTTEDQKRFEVPRRDLETLNRQLLRQLFPRQPGSTPQKEKPHP